MRSVNSVVLVLHVYINEMFQDIKLMMFAGLWGHKD